MIRSNDKQLDFAVEILTSNSVDAGSAQRREETREAGDHSEQRDGQRFLMVDGGETVQSTPIHVTLNWFEELERLVPTP